MGATFTWDNTAAQAWVTNHWGRGAQPLYPGDAGSAVTDKVVVATAVHPTSAPGAALTVAEYTCAASDFDCGANLTVTAVLTMGTALGADAPVFSGVAAAGCAVLFQGAATNSGTVGDYARFNDGAINGVAGIVGDYATFNGTALSFGTVGDYATFNDATTNSGGVNDYATFNGTALNAGVVGDYATFNGTALSSGTVGDYATFNDAGFNFAGLVGDYATFNGTAYSTGGTVGDHATFNSAAAATAAEFTGGAYTIAASTTFDATAEFSGGPVTFTLSGPSAQLIGILTTDGGVTPLAVVVDLSPAAAIGPFPIAAAAIGPFPMNGTSVGPYPVTP